MFTSDSHAICDMMGVAGVAISCPGCWQLSINRMLGVVVRVLVVVLRASEESVRQELREGIYTESNSPHSSCRGVGRRTKRCLYGSEPYQSQRTSSMSMPAFEQAASRFAFQSSTSYAALLISS